ncbi:MAG TPA: vWA domain-containing protein [Methanoregulaceae archaeon]|nr:vWA domain-containing protein [Methanoregulaceae archaeon]HRU80600.1 vWA domain-containing protein [Methanolinea sp.]
MQKFGVLCIIGLLLLVGIGNVAAYVPLPDRIDLYRVEPGKDWLIANSSDSCTYAARVYNQSISLSGIKVTFSIDETDMGSFSPSYTYTDVNGYAESRFLTKTKSGDARIIAKAFYIENGTEKSIFNTTIQKIDHDTPYVISSYDIVPEKTVGTETSISIGLSDRWNNPIDNRNTIEEIYFEVGSPSSLIQNDPNRIAAGFWDESNHKYVKSILSPVNESGVTNVIMRMDTKPGANIIYVKPYNLPIRERYFTIQGIADGIPIQILQDIDPPTLQVPAYQDYLFILNYTLLDQWGNGLANHAILFNTSRGEIEVIYTNHMGWARRTYGPSGYQGTVDIFARPEENQSIYQTATLHFVNTTAVDMVLSANPTTMPSGDVPVSSSVPVIAKVVDIMGNPVKNMPVHFEIIHSPDYPASQVKPPSFSSTEILNQTTILTNDQGQAIAQFWPGHFETNSSLSAPYYDDQATASCTVKATWYNEIGIPTERNLELTWKNYPWISVKTSASPIQVEVNDTVDVKVQIIGDGWALQPKPIDVILVIDVSGSMAGTDISPSRMEAAKTAAKNFVQNLDLSKDRIGLVKFSSRASLVQGLTNDSSVITSAINSLQASGGTNLREAYYRAIKDLKQNGRDNAVKAVIAMTDGDWNLHGNPLAMGIGFPDTNPDKTVRYKVYETDYDVARSSYPWLATGSSFNQASIRDTKTGNSYSVNGYEWYSDLPDPKGTITSVQKWWYRYYPLDENGVLKQGYVCTDGLNTNQNMSVYANSTTVSRKVRLYAIGFAQDLNDDVENALRTLTLSTDGWYSWAGNAEKLNSLYSQIAGELKTEASVDTQMDISYENVVIDSTYPGGEVFDYVHVPDISTYIRSYYTNNTPVGTPLNRDDTPNWTAANKYTLSFNIGTIKLLQVWEANYRLRVKKPGNINIFPNSSINFRSADNVGQNVAVPVLFISAAFNLTNVSISTPSLDLTTPVEKQITNYIREWTWERNYTGEGTITERYWISIDGGKQWIKVGERPNIPSNEKDGYFRLDLQTIDKGIENSKTIKFRVQGFVYGAQSPITRETGGGGGNDDNNIKIKLF